jgi:uncharacterized protein (DUF1778 family)
MNRKEITKDKRLTIRATKKELENIKKQAEKNGYKSVSQFMIDKTIN